jgi:serine phosphatase RsbU (regulator of sigma subunit)
VSGTSSSSTDDYAVALARYVGHGGEHQLEAAFALGRWAVADGMTILGLVDQHRAAVARLAQGGTTLGPAQVEATFQFLSEALATFEMAQRGYWEAKEVAARERSIALMLQHELLPAALPVVPGLDVAVRYLPGEATSQAGGDWYDLFPLPDGRVGLVVGDVTGHGVAAAASMGQMRMAVLAYALGGFEPGDVVGRVDVLVEALGRGHVATMVYAIADVATHELVVANAGHPPPVVVPPVGEGPARTVEAGQGLLLGLDPALNRRSGESVAVPPGSHVLFYTDGLIEPLERQERDGVGRLLEVTDGFAGGADALCEHVLAELTPDQSGDDICTLAITFTG